MKDIEEIKKERSFVWGEMIAWHELGPYTLVEYHPWKRKGCSVLRGIPSEEIAFYGWIDSKSSGESWPTLETGIAGLIGKKYAGLNNGGVGYYFCKMIDAPPYDKKET